MSKYETQYIQDERNVPSGYVPLTSFDSQSTDHKRLSSAHAKGLIRAVKMMRTQSDHRCGRVWVHEQDAKNFLLGNVASVKAKAARVGADCASPLFNPSQVEAAITALCEINNGISLMQATLERLTAAVELIATQPKTAQQELVSTFESNGFHQ